MKNRAVCAGEAREYHAYMDTPLGTMLAVSDGEALVRLDFSDGARERCEQASALPVFADTRRWLDAYFAGCVPDFTPQLRLCGSPFRMRVWEMLLTIPYGEVTTYGALAARIALETGGRMAAQAVGGAVGKNPVTIIVPCHRVVGTNGNLTGYAGGMERKVRLLAREGLDMARFTLPRS